MLFLIDFILHIDRHLSEIVAAAGWWSYAVLFGIVFCETGLIITPFLPGDSLLFAAGSMAALGAFELPLLLFVLFAAAVIGDAFNYWMAREWGLRLLEGPFARFVDKKHLEKANRFYAKYGAKAIVLARFVPIMRTVAPFTAGIARMEYRRFATYNVVGAALWVLIFTMGGYLFGNIPWVKKHFSVVVIAIIVISLIPVFIDAWRSYRERKGADKLPKA